MYHLTHYRFQNITLHQIETYILLFNALVINWAQTILSLKHCCLLKCFQPKGLSSQYLSNLNSVFSLIFNILCLRNVVYSSFNIHSGIFLNFGEYLLDLGLQTGVDRCLRNHRKSNEIQLFPQEFLALV